MRPADVAPPGSAVETRLREMWPYAKAAAEAWEAASQPVEATPPATPPAAAPPPPAAAPAAPAAPAADSPPVPSADGVAAPSPVRNPPIKDVIRFVCVCFVIGEYYFLRKTAAVGVACWLDPFLFPLTCTFREMASHPAQLLRELRWWSISGFVVSGIFRFCVGEARVEGAASGTVLKTTRRRTRGLDLNTYTALAREWCTWGALYSDRTIGV